MFFHLLITDLSWYMIGVSPAFDSPHTAEATYSRGMDSMRLPALLLGSAGEVGEAAPAFFTTNRVPPLTQSPRLPVPFY